METKELFVCAYVSRKGVSYRVHRVAGSATHVTYVGAARVESPSKREAIKVGEAAS